MTDIKWKNLALGYVSYIYYLVFFPKNNNNIVVLNIFGSEVNIITLTYTLKLGFHIWKTNINA